MLTTEQIATYFTHTGAVIAENQQLRPPQREGHAAATEFFAAGGRRAVEQLPVGCGKTGLIAALPYSIARGRVLVIGPNLTISGQLAAAFDTSSQTCAYRRFGILPPGVPGPSVATLDAQANLDDLNRAHVVVSNIQQLSGRSGRWLPNMAEDFFDLIIADEGHHAAARTWREAFDRFPNAKVIGLTATPFRSDNQAVEGERIYRYAIADAMRNGFITNILSTNVAPAQVTFSYRDEDREHDLDEVLRLREKDWFAKGVALSDACNISIVDASIQWLQELRDGGQVEHQIVAAACSIDHARRIRALYQERGWRAAEIHSEMDDREQAQIHRQLKNHELDVIVQVSMLGEGFDHPPLSVAAVFRPFKSLAPYVQFVGRVMRVNRENAVGHPDNRAVLVSHVGLNVERHWADFKSIDDVDAQDHETLQDWLAGDTPAPRKPGIRRQMQPSMIVTQEQVLDRFLTEEFLTIPVDQVPDRVLDAIRAQGIDPAAAGLDRDIIIEQMRKRDLLGPTSPVAQTVQPQARRKAQKTLLAERIRSVANRICEATGLSRGGRKLASRGGTGATNDLQAVITMVHREVNLHVERQPNSRRDWSIDEIDDAMSNLDAIADRVQAQIETKIS